MSVVVSAVHRLALVASVRIVPSLCHRYPAHTSGEIAHGDALLEINGREIPQDELYPGQANKVIMSTLSECAPGDVMQLVTEGLDFVQRSVLLIREDPATLQTNAPVDDSCSASLGIIFDNFLNVSLVLPGSPAHLSGQVALYDKLLSVDGTPLQSSSTQQEVQELLRRDAGQRVKLLFARARFRKDQLPREEEVELVAAPLLDPARAIHVIRHKSLVQNHRIAGDTAIANGHKRGGSRVRLGASPKAPAASASAVEAEMTLSVCLNSVGGEVEQAKKILALDVADAVGADISFVHPLSLAGVNDADTPPMTARMRLESGVGGKTRAPLMVARDLELQALDASSLLRHGTLSRFITRLRVVAAPDPQQQLTLANLKFMNRMSRHGVRRDLARAYESWRMHAGKQRQLLQAAGRVVRHWRNKRMALAWDTWCAHAHAQAHQRQRLARIASRWRLGGVSVAFYSWQENASKQKRAESICRRIVGHWQHQATAGAFEIWTEHAAEQVGAPSVAVVLGTSAVPVSVPFLIPVCHDSE